VTICYYHDNNYYGNLCFRFKDDSQPPLETLHVPCVILRSGNYLCGSATPFIDVLHAIFSLSSLEKLEMAFSCRVIAKGSSILPMCKNLHELTIQVELDQSWVHIVPELIIAAESLPRYIHLTFVSSLYPHRVVQRRIVYFTLFQIYFNSKFIN